MGQQQQQQQQEIAAGSALRRIILVLAVAAMMALMMVAMAGPAFTNGNPQKGNPQDPISHDAPSASISDDSVTTFKAAPAGGTSPRGGEDTSNGNPGQFINKTHCLHGLKVY
jgi:hypothetical protein